MHGDMIALVILLLFLLLIVLAGAASSIAGEPVRRLVGGVLIAVGILIMTGSGLCSLAIIVSVIGSRSPESGIAFLALLIGGLPFASGLAMFLRGRHLIRAARPPSDEELRERFD